MESSTANNLTGDNTNTTTAAFSMNMTIMLVTVQTFVAVFICGGNALVIFIIAKTRTLQTVTSISVINLAVVDFLVGVSDIPLILSIIRPELVHHYPVCCIRVGYMTCITFVSVATLTGRYDQPK